MNIQELLRKKGELTDAEYAALDEYYTVNTIIPAGGKAGYFARNYGMPVYLDRETLERLSALAGDTHASPEEIIGGLVREQCAAMV